MPSIKFLLNDTRTRCLAPREIVDEYDKRKNRIDYPLKELQQYYDLPIKEAAEKLYTCEAVLKRICRRKNIRRWPFRQLLSITKKRNNLQNHELYYYKNQDNDNKNNKKNQYSIDEEDHLIDIPTIDPIIQHSLFKILVSYSGGIYNITGLYQSSFSTIYQKIQETKKIMDYEKKWIIENAHLIKVGSKECHDKWCDYLKSKNYLPAPLRLNKNKFLVPINSDNHVNTSLKCLQTQTKTVSSNSDLLINNNNNMSKRKWLDKRHLDSVDSLLIIQESSNCMCSHIEYTYQEDIMSLPIMPTNYSVKNNTISFKNTISMKDVLNYVYQTNNIT